MKKPFRIAVLSDQHIDREEAPESWELAKAAYKAVAKAGVDHVVLAGDIFDCATAMERDQDKVCRYLKRLGLWHRDRLTVVVGNHDIFHTPHWGNRKLGLAKAVALRDAQERYDSFCDWIDDLADDDDRLDPDGEDLYPIAKDLGHVCLVAMDTTAEDTASSGNGRWPGEDDRIVRSFWDAAPHSGRNILAIHNAPVGSAKNNVIDLIKEWALTGEEPEPVLGYPSATLGKLKRFVSDLRFDAVVCGHLHDPGDDEYHWKIGTGRRLVDVYLVGRTGGVHGTAPCFGVLEVPDEGKLTWEEVSL